MDYGLLRLDSFSPVPCLSLSPSFSLSVCLPVDIHFIVRCAFERLIEYAKAFTFRLKANYLLKAYIETSH